MRTERFAWAALRLPGRELEGAGSDPEAAARRVRSALDAGARVALGFEAPLVVPVPVADASAWRRLGSARTGDGDRPWSAGAGTGALATGLVQAAWVCSRVAALGPPVAATTDIDRWGEGVLLLWEAFVSGKGRPVPGEFGQHAADAAAAAEAFADRWDSGRLRDSDVHCHPDRPLNLAAVAATHAGLRIDAAELTHPMLVIRTEPADSTA